MAEFILKKLRGYVKTWPTTIPGVLLLVNAISSILICVFDPACGMDVISKEWDKIMQAVIGLGLMEARSTFTSSQELKLWLMGGLISAGLVSATVPVQAGVALDDSQPIALPELPQSIEDPSWLDRGSIWTFAWVDAGNGDNGAGVRLGYEATEHIRLRFDYLVESFDFDSGVVADQSEGTLSMRYEMAPGNNWFPYLIAGGGSASLASFEWEYLIGAGVDYEFANGVTAFAEFIHIRTEAEDFADRNEIRAGVGVDLSVFGKLPIPFLKK